MLYSDGLVENRQRGLDAGLDELVRIAADAPPDLLGAPGRLLQYLLDHMLAGYEQDDDVTVLVLHVPAASENAGDAGHAGRRGQGPATGGGCNGEPGVADRHGRRVQGTPRGHLWWWRGGGRVAVDIPMASGKPASRHGPGVEPLSGGAPD